MPFTPFHLGPGLLIGLIFKQWINIPAILIASIIVDVRAAYCLFTGCYPLHGPLHTFLGALILSSLVIFSIYLFRDRLKPISIFLKIKQDYSLQSIVIGAVIGVWSHVILDAFLYPEMVPFWPVHGNPFIGIFGSIEIYGFCIMGFVIGGMIYWYILYNIWHYPKSH